MKQVYDILTQIENHFKDNEDNINTVSFGALEKVDLDKVKQEEPDHLIQPIKINKRDQTTFSWKCKGCQKDVKLIGDATSEQCVAAPFDSAGQLGLE